MFLPLHGFTPFDMCVLSEHRRGSLYINSYIKALIQKDRVAGQWLREVFLTGVPKACQKSWLEQQSAVGWTGLAGVPWKLCHHVDIHKSCLNHLNHTSGSPQGTSVG